MLTTVDPFPVTRRDAADGSAFAALLREYRSRQWGRRGARLSQSELAEAAGFDHSYVSRLESGTRTPTRSAVTALADALKLSSADEDALLSAAGYMPGDIANILAHEPVIVQALDLLSDTDIPAAIRNNVRHIIGLLVEQAHNTQEQLAAIAD